MNIQTQCQHTLFSSSILPASYSSILLLYPICHGEGIPIPEAHIFVVGASGILRKSNFQRNPKIYQGFGITFFPQKFFILGVLVHLFAHSLKSKNSVYQINVQILATRVEFSGYLLFFVSSITMPKKPTVNRVKPTSYKVVRDSFFFSFWFVRTVFCFAFILNSANAQFNNRLGFSSVIGS